MPVSPLFPRVAALTAIQIDATERWHGGSIENSHENVEGLVVSNHEFNFRLWHQEDLARDPSATDESIANVKRAIDKLNQARNDMIEKIDDALAESIVENQIRPAENAGINTETPGSAIDRLSIMALRLYHYREDARRPDVDQDHRRKVRDRIELCQQQHADLSASLQDLVDDIAAGRKQHRTYRQMKMYNDPTLNPAIYKS